MESDNLTQSQKADLATAQSWLHTYVCRHDPRLNRDGAVCPFVPPALRADTLRVESWPVEQHAGLPELLQAVERMISVFEATDWPSGNPTLHSMLVVLTGLPRDRLRQLDRAHAQMKPAIVQRGLMLSQFHEACTEPAARNPRFHALRAPVPMLVLRRMALHDIVFLDSSARWFAEYERRFGERYDRGSVSDPLFTSRFNAARVRFGGSSADHLGPGVDFLDEATWHHDRTGQPIG